MLLTTAEQLQRYTEESSMQFSGATACTVLIRQEQSTDTGMLPRHLSARSLGAATSFSTDTPVDSPTARQDPSDPYLALYVASCGDCRAVLSRAGVASDLSEDHKPSRVDEHQRIVRAGGWVHNGRLNGVLAVSRAFGDLEYKTLKEKCWETEFAFDPLTAVPVRLHVGMRARTVNRTTRRILYIVELSLHFTALM